MGLTLNTKAGLGVSPIISLSYAASVIWNRNFGDMTFVLYGIFCLDSGGDSSAGERRSRTQLAYERCSAVSIEYCIYKISECIFSVHTAAGRMWTGGFWTFRTHGVLVLALTFTGVGAAMSLSMRLVPNPGDGLVQVLADTFGIDTGLMKNCVDVTLYRFVTAHGAFVCGKTGGNRHWNGLCCRAGGARDCAVSSYFWKGDAAGGWTGKWQELTECVEKGVRKIKAADF